MEARLPKHAESAVKDGVFLVTGGAGFVGSTLVDHLVARGAREVRALDFVSESTPANLVGALATGGVSLIQGDLRDPRVVDRACAGVDFIFHQAAIRVTRCQEEPRVAHEILVDGTFNLLEAAVKHRVKKVIAASSAIVYGPPRQLPVPEDHPLLDRTMYGVAKIANELLFEAFYQRDGLPYVLLRYFNVYGPRMNLAGPHTEVLIKWLDRIDEGEAPLLFGDGNQTMDFIDIDDVVRANLLALGSSVTHDVFNVGTGKETSLNELARLLLKLTQSSREPEYRAARSVNQIERRFADPKKALEILGFQAKVNLAEGLRRLMEWRALV